MFDGSISEPKVSLAGRGRRSESRAEFLRRQAREREDRERKRVRDIAATKIQAAWRRHRCRRAAKAAQRQIFDARLADVAKVESLLPEDKRAVLVVNALQKYLLRPFTFFFSGGEDEPRLNALLRLIRSPGGAKIFAASLVEDQRESILAHSRCLLSALLSLQRTGEALQLLLVIRDVLYDGDVPVHPQRFPEEFGEQRKPWAPDAAIGFLLRGTQVLQQTLQEALPAVDLLLLACTGMEASAELPRWDLLVTLLSAPALPGLLERAPEELRRSFYQRLALLIGPCFDAKVMEEVAGLKRIEWMAANTGLLFAPLPIEPQLAVNWLRWIQVRLPCDFWTGGAKAQQRRCFWNPSLALKLAGAEPLLDTVLELYFQVPPGLEEPAEEPDDVVQELAFKSNFVEYLRPTADVKARLGDFNTQVALRLQAFCLLFKVKLQAAFDSELDEPGGWWSRLDAPQLLPFLNRLLCALLREEPDRSQLPPQGKALRRSLLRLLRALCDRQRRKALAPGTWWLQPELRSLLQDGRLAELRAHISGALGAEAGDAATAVGGSRELLETVLVEAPQMLPFEDRVALLHALILSDQAEREDTRADWARASQPRHRIRRDRLMEDGFSAFENLRTAELRAVFVVEFVAVDGSLESGIDGGGLFKEFMIYVCRTAFGPDYGLFSANSDHKLYPFPGAFVMHPDADKFFRFLGKVVGKAIYEMMLLEPQFSRAFLNRVLGRESDIEDVASVDRDLHRGLRETRLHPRVEELGLTFSTAVAMPGNSASEVELLPNGAQVEVTKDNLDRYLHLVAHHRASIQIQEQSTAFREGMELVLHPSWIQMFDARELGILISGSSTGFNVSDLREHTVYAGGYTERSQVVRWLWELLAGMDHEDMGRFLMFATSCSRPPLLGFQSFDPKFCIHKVHDASRLPTASTCANLLKLPEYPSMALLREKLLQAIRSESGFDLS